MKELEDFLKPKEIKEVAQAEQEYRLELDESITPHRGHILFKVDLDTGKISEAEYAHDLVWCPKKATFIPENATLIKEAGYKYVSALNKSNVEKKLSKNNNGSRINHSKKHIKI
jgi:hypothetical protein